MPRSLLRAKSLQIAIKARGLVRRLVPNRCVHSIAPLPRPCCQSKGRGQGEGYQHDCRSRLFIPKACIHDFSLNSVASFAGLMLEVEVNFKSRTIYGRPELTIGEVAAKAVLATSAIRYYERMGLLKQPLRKN